MKIIVLSDSHGRRAKFDAVLTMHPMADLYIFLGDGVRDAEEIFEKHSVKSNIILLGNCDLVTQSNYLTETTLDLDGVRIFCCHGHTKGVKYGLSSLNEYAGKKDASLALFGHTHRPIEEAYNDVTCFNPGALKDGSFGIIYIEKGKILCSHGEV